MRRKLNVVSPFTISRLSSNEMIYNNRQYEPNRQTTSFGCYVVRCTYKLGFDGECSKAVSLFPVSLHIFFRTFSIFFFCNSKFISLHFTKYQLNYSRKGFCSEKRSVRLCFWVYIRERMRNNGISFIVRVSMKYPAQRFVSTKYVLNGSQTKRNPINNNNDVT